jgi:nucleolar protein 4
LFKTSANAQKAVEKLHAHVFKGSFLSATIKKRLDSLAKSSASVVASRDSQVATPSRNPPHSQTASSAPNHASRLIVRNIPFNATEQDLRAVFLPYGPIYSIHIPSSATTGVSEGPEKITSTNDTGSVKKITAGFAFIWMLSKKDAEKAIEGCDGIVIRAGMAGSMVQDKQKRKKQRREEKKMAQVKDEEDVEVDGGVEEDVVGGLLFKERKIAVDWALSKGKWVEEKAKMPKEDEVKDEDEDENDLEMRTDSETSDAGGDEDSADDDRTSDGSSDESDKPTKPQLPPPETGTTLFVRNVPFTATEDELRTLYVSHFFHLFVLYSFVQLSCFWSVTIRSSYCRWCNWPNPGDWIYLLLEKGRCRQGHSTE